MQNVMCELVTPHPHSATQLHQSSLTPNKGKIENRGNAENIAQHGDDPVPDPGIDGPILDPGIGRGDALQAPTEDTALTQGDLIVETILT